MAGERHERRRQRRVLPSEGSCIANNLADVCDDDQSGCPDLDGGI